MSGAAAGGCKREAGDGARAGLIRWQGPREEALALARETGRPILACINMDGEIASEYYAGRAYRDPELAAFLAPYVCIVASVYRHNPRDHDEQGRRVPCPRFGTVTCGEHIAIEPILYERFLDGRRVAPRHIMIEVDGSEVFDVFYTWDTASVFQTIRDGIANRKEQPAARPRGDRSLAERLASPDSADREAVERAWLEGDREQRRLLLQAAVAAGGRAPVELLRLAVYDLDPELAGLGRQALARSESPQAVDLIAKALQQPLPAAERDALVAALERFGQKIPRARTLAVVHRGLAADPGLVDPERWAEALAGAAAPEVPGWDQVQARLDYWSELAASRPDDAAAQLEAAEAFLTFALDERSARVLGAAGPRRGGGDMVRLLLEDARRLARRAGELGASGWRLDTVLALTAFHLGEREAALEHASRAVAALPPGRTDWQAAAVLAVFASLRQEDILQAVRKQEDWPPGWLADVHAAWSVLAAHPRCSEAMVVQHHDFLRRLGADAAADRVLERGLRRFPESWELHARLRRKLLVEEGVAGLERHYAAWLERPDAPRHLAWFAGYAAVVTAEFHRRAGRRDEAMAAYGRAIGLYEQCAAEDPATAASSRWYEALCLAGQARLDLEEGRLEPAVERLLAAFEREPRAAASLDGLGLSAVATARTLQARCRRDGRDDLAVRIQEGLDRLAEVDPALLEPPAFERGGAGRRRR